MFAGRGAGSPTASGSTVAPDGVTMLVYGTRDTNDICWYPRSNKIFWRGVGVMGRIEQLEYLDGEPVEDDRPAASSAAPRTTRSGRR